MYGMMAAAAVVPTGLVRCAVVKVDPHAAVHLVILYRLDLVET